jgi:hypothetical protein
MMEKIIRLTENQLTDIVKNLLKENNGNRIVYGSQINNKRNEELITKGYEPYYLDLSKKGDYKVVMVKDLKKDLPKTTFYFLNGDEYSKVLRLTENVNDLISEYLKMIDLYTQQLIGVIEQKIIK